MRISNYTFSHPKNYLYTNPVKGLQSCKVGYRFTFNGKEKDNEGMGGGGSTYDYGFRIYNAQLGKFLSVDPLTKKFPYYSPYQFSGNRPIACLDLDGLEDIYYMSSFISRMGAAVISLVKSTELGNKFLDQFQDPINNKGIDVYIIAKPLSNGTALNDESGVQGKTSVVYDPNSAFNFAGKISNVYTLIEEIRKNKQNGIENSGEAYNALVSVLGEEILFSDGLGKTIKECRSIAIVTINSKPLDEAIKLNSENKPENKSSFWLNIAISAKALGHEFGAHLLALIKGEELDPVKHHTEFQGVPVEGYVVKGSTADKFNTQIDDARNCIMTN